MTKNNEKEVLSGQRGSKKTKRAQYHESQSKKIPQEEFGQNAAETSSKMKI